jgi:hypothetical protein
MKVNRVQRDPFRELLSQLEKAGVSREQLFCELRLRGVTASITTKAVIAGAEEMVLLETAVKLTGDPCLAIRLGQAEWGKGKAIAYRLLQVNNGILPGSKNAPHGC